jgi:hypothetical protein
MHLDLPRATRLAVQLTGGPVLHPGSGYRAWEGQFKSEVPIVALAVVVSGKHVCWSRTSHRGSTCLKTSVTYCPYDEAGPDVQLVYSILGARSVSRTLVPSTQAEPMPRPQTFRAGLLVDIAKIDTEPPCILRTLVLARSDVTSVRNGVWHARGDMVNNVIEPWRKMLTYGRTEINWSRGSP